MSKVTIDTSIPVCLIVNENPILANHLSRSLIGMGISASPVNENEITSASFENVVYVIWFYDSASAFFDKLNTLIDPAKTSIAKLLCIMPLDDVFDTQEALDEDGVRIHDTIKELHVYGKASKLDIRVIGTANVWDFEVQDTKRTPISLMIKELHHGNFVLSPTSVLYPLNASDVAQTVIGLWFDRGHRNQTVLLRGQPLSCHDLSLELDKAYPGLTHKSRIFHWGVGEGMQVDERKEVIANPADFTRYLASQVRILKTPHPVASPASPPVIPKTTTAQSPVRFETVVVPEEQPRTEPPPVKPPPPPPPRQEPVSPAPKPPSRTVAKKAPAVTGRTRFPLLPVGAVAVALLALVIPFALLFVRLKIAEAATPKTSSEDLVKYRVNLDGAVNFVDSMTGWLARVPPYKSLRIDLDKSVNAAKKHLLLVQAQSQLARAVKLMLTASEGDPYEPLRLAKHTLDELYVLESVQPALAPSDFHEIAQTRKIVDVLPYLIPADKKITILVMLQNNLELRPTGGFLGAVTLLTFDHGKLLTVDTRDIYDLDSNLKGVVTPPADLKTYLGEAGWYFRDSNWSSDFIESAGTANWFLEKEWGNPADIIVGVNLNTLKLLLEATGPLTLPDGQVIGNDNLLATAFNHQDAPVNKPGSGKQEFFSLFVKPLIDRAAAGDSDQIAALLKTIMKAANHNELTVVAGNKVALAGLVDLGWTGAIFSPVCPVNHTSPCITDSFYMNEANIGINKSNFNITRSHDHTVTLGNTEIRHAHTVKINNTSPNETWPAGNYKSFTRIYLPPNAAGIALMVNGNPVASADFTVTAAVTGQIVGFVYEAKPQSNAAVNLTYSVPVPSGYNSYVFGWQKQPGASSDPAALVIMPPPARAVTKMSPELKTASNPAFSGTLDKNLTVSLEFSP